MIVRYLEGCVKLPNVKNVEKKENVDVPNFEKVIKMDRATSNRPVAIVSPGREIIVCVALKKGLVACRRKIRDECVRS